MFSQWTVKCFWPCKATLQTCEFVEAYKAISWVSIFLRSQSPRIWFPFIFHISILLFGKCIEREIGILIQFQGLHMKSQRKPPVQNPAISYVPHKLCANAEIWWESAVRGAAKNIWLSSQISTAHWMNIIFVSLNFLRLFSFPLQST